MKAKHWFNLFKDSKTKDDLYTHIEDCLNSLCIDVSELIKTRHAKTHEAIKSCVLEVNNKWLAIVRLWESYQKKLESGGLEDINSQWGTVLDADGFKAAYVSLHPDHKYVFDLNKHIDKMNKIREERIAPLMFHKVTPLKDLTDDKILEEYMNCLASLGSARSHGIPLEWCTPLAYRCFFLKYWIDNKSISKSDIDEFEQNPAAWVADHQ